MASQQISSSSLNWHSLLGALPSPDYIRLFPTPPLKHGLKSHLHRCLAPRRHDAATARQRVVGPLLPQAQTQAHPSTDDRFGVVVDHFRANTFNGEHQKRPQTLALTDHSLCRPDPTARRRTPRQGRSTRQRYRIHRLIKRRNASFLAWQTGSNNSSLALLLSLQLLISPITKRHQVLHWDYLNDAMTLYPYYLSSSIPLVSNHGCLFHTVTMAISYFELGSL